MKKISTFLTKYAKATLIAGVVLLVAAGVYGIGLFSELKSSDNFFAKDAPSQTVNAKLEELFGKSGESNIVVLLERKANSSLPIESAEAAKEVSTLLGTLKTKSVVSYYTSGVESFLSRDKSATYAVVTLDGDAATQFNEATDFAKSARSDTFDVSIGGALVGREQTQEQVKVDLQNAELISLPILALLLFVFFRSPFAASLPLLMSALTICGALAAVRFVQLFVSIDTYSLNVISILSVGLSIDYCLLAVNRFREELAGGVSPSKAAVKTAQTAGRTILFSGTTVAICLLALIVFPIDFMHSVSIGGTAAVLVAMLISSFLLPTALFVVGKNIDKWHVGKKTIANESNGWGKVAAIVTKRPILSIVIGLGVIILSALPLRSFHIGSFDWHVLPSNLSAYHVGKVIDEKFDNEVASVNVLALYAATPKPSEVCKTAEALGAVKGAKSVTTAYSPLTQAGADCDTLDQTLEFLAVSNPEKAAAIRLNAASYLHDSYARFDIVSTNDATDNATFELVSKLRTLNISGTTLSVSGLSALTKDTLDSYGQWIPVVAGIIIVAMIVILSLLLGSVVLPLQAVVINSLSLIVALGIIVAVFHNGVGASVLHVVTISGFEPSIPILVMVMAFGLSMDYAVFLYSRIHEVYDKTGDVRGSIIHGVAKTGPIITSAAVLMFVVVAAFGLSHVVLIQQVGVGLSAAVILDAFFVRVFFVPAVMQLFGKTSWLAPEWLKDRTIKHE